MFREKGKKDAKKRERKWWENKSISLNSSQNEKELLSTGSLISFEFGWEWKASVEREKIIQE